VAWARTADAPRWAHGWSVARGVPVMMRQTPLHRPNGFAGVLVSVVTVPELARRIALVSARRRRSGLPALRAHQVVAHSQPRGGFVASPQQPLPTVTQAGDPILARIWDAARRSRRKSWSRACRASASRPRKAS
jgi:hypothetical protein